MLVEFSTLGLVAELNFRFERLTVIRLKIQIIMKYLLLFFLFLSSSVSATSYDVPSLNKLVSISDTIIEGKVVDVILMDYENNILDVKNARTGLGSGYMISITISIEETITSIYPPKKQVSVLLDPNSIIGYDSLKSSKLNKSFIFFLKGQNMSSAYPIFFWQELKEKEAIKEIAIKTKNEQHL
ncbi:hypothetical protein E2K93_09975 [Thalassotalea sp. HSM 43]|uniref:hypothetical protein n=1 Tax=Thalassotalea sp. HSM 43 TaxID=2552945 RepID=UPI0010815622|nr:hypothetical protein [Thalassotalea sp. HSM 43]QBY04698.1 hypothetical protein E2K93_09975 [Thalassotalea sp. HSM 43]